MLLELITVAFLIWLDDVSQSDTICLSLNSDSVSVIIAVAHSHCLRWFADSHNQTVFCSCRRETKVFLFTALKVSASPETSDNCVAPFRKEQRCFPPPGVHVVNTPPPSSLCLSLSPFSLTCRPVHLPLHQQEGALLRQVQPGRRQTESPGSRHVG